MSEANEEVTLDQANAALKTIMGGDTDQPEETVSFEESGATEQAPDQTSEASEVEVAQDGDEEVAQEGHEDDATSLEARLKQLEEERENERKTAEERLTAIQARHEESDRILRDRFVRKSSVVDRARQVLEKALTEEGASSEEVKSALEQIQGTLNPQSQNYNQPQYQPQQAPQANQEDQVLSMLNFLNEKGMNQNEANEFGRWVQTEGQTALTQTEQNIAHQNTDAFLRLAHYRWLETKTNQTKTRDQAVAATKSVQRTQKAAQKASGKPTGQRNSRGSEPTQTMDDYVSNMTQKDVRDLLRQSIDQYK